MALINCPECGKENVSDSANSCPNCGYNLKEHFEKLNREIELKKAKEEREKREKEREASVDRFIDKLKTPINRFKSFTKIKKIICVLIICVLIAGIIGIVNVSSSMIRKAQIQTFQSKEAMINSVVGDYADAERIDNPYMFCSINENYVFWNHELFIMDSDVYAIKEWDYENGKIIYDDDSELTVLKNGNLESKAWTFSKKNYRHNLDLDITDVRWREESGKTKCTITLNGTIKNQYSKGIQIKGLAFTGQSKEEQNKDLLRAANIKREPTTRAYYFHDSIVEFEFNMIDVNRVVITVKEDKN